MMVWVVNGGSQVTGENEGIIKPITGPTQLQRMYNEDSAGAAGSGFFNLCQRVPWLQPEPAPPIVHFFPHGPETFLVLA